MTVVHEVSVFCVGLGLKAHASAATSQTISTANKTTQTTGYTAKYFGNNSPLKNSRDVII